MCGVRPGRRGLVGTPCHPRTRSVGASGMDAGRGARMSLLAVAVGGRGLVDPDEPVLHADDEALLRGRGVFETLRVYGGRPFRLDDHLARLADSAARLGLAPVDGPAVADLA